MLTVNQLKAMPPLTIFATGLILNPRIYRERVRWIAQRGKIYDWTIYYHLPDWHIEQIAANGDKLCSDDLIKKLVPCTDEAFSLYRF